MDKFQADTTNLNWKSLYRVGSIASLLMVLIVPTQLVVFMISPPPGTIPDWFSLFHSNSFLGLLTFELLMVTYVIFSIPLAVALYTALKRVSPSLMAIYLALTFVGSVLFIVARPAFEMLALSQQYAVATTDAQRTVLLAAGETMLAIFHGTAFQVSYILGSIGGLILSAVMLRSTFFGKATAYVRIASSVLDFGIFIPVVGLYVSIFSVVFLWIFHMLIALRLFQLGKTNGDSHD